MRIEPEIMLIVLLFAIVALLVVESLTLYSLLFR